VNPFLQADDRVICHGANPLTRRQLLRRAAALAARLPARERLVNLCETRSNFLIAFVASMLRRQPQLLPGTRTPEALAELDRRFPSTHMLTDAMVRDWGLAGELAETAADEVLANFAIAPGELVLTGFTSGSTGTSQPHDKRFQALQASARCNGAAIRSATGLASHEPLAVLATVPVHHMYGIELSVLLPLFAGMSVHDDRPMFPADVAAALARSPSPRVLVSTPLHLRALAESDLAFPQVALIVSASAPLEAALAARIEDRLGAPLLEMFGSTETCVFATRHTARQPEWQLYDEVGLSPDDGGTRVSAPWFAQDQVLQDVVELRGERGFVLRGRSSDLIEVAGKRASLADITRRLCAIPGIKDAVVYQPEAAAGSVNRVAALIVGEGVTEKQIIEVLSAGLDAAFLPRPLVFVDAIPRDALGKIPRAGLRDALNPR
jgi:acyl-coenzyme A synthetase/AMP-(fatty) acid ligase